MLWCPVMAVFPGLPNGAEVFSQPPAKWSGTSHWLTPSTVCQPTASIGASSWMAGITRRVGTLPARSTGVGLRIGTLRTGAAEVSGKSAGSNVIWLANGGGVTVGRRGSTASPKSAGAPSSATSFAALSEGSTLMPPASSKIAPAAIKSQVIA